MGQAHQFDLSDGLVDSGKVEYCIPGFGWLNLSTSSFDEGCKGGVVCHRAATILAKAEVTQESLFGYVFLLYVSQSVTVYTSR